MARKILCENCNKDVVQFAEQTSEVWDKVEGSAQKNLNCDDCGADIPEGANCFAGCLIDTIDNPIYQKQKPSKWAGAYINY